VRGSPPEAPVDSAAPEVPSPRVRAARSLPTRPGAAALAVARSRTEGGKVNTVRFAGVEEDSLDSMLRRTQERLRQGGTSTAGGDGRASWKVSDQQIEQLVLSMSSAPPSQASRRASSQAGGALRASGLGRAGAATISASASAPARLADDGRIDVWIYFLQSEDLMRLRVPLDLPAGPPKAPSSNRFTDMYGLGASTKGFDLAKHTFDHRRREFTPANREDWVPEGGGSLKQLIEEYAEIEASRMRLFYRQIPLSNDQLTLRSYGIKDGDTISLRIQRFVPGCSMGRDVQLATSKRLEPSAEERSGASKYDGYSLRFCKRLKEFRNANGDVYMQPKWCSEMNPRLFAKVGVAVDGAGNFSAAPNQLDAPIWIRDKDNEKLRRVRLAVAGRM